jgi:hypothetical protein
VQTTDVKQFCILEYNAMQSLEHHHMFLSTACYVIPAGFINGLIFKSEDGSNIFLKNIR